MSESTETPDNIGIEQSSSSTTSSVSSPTSSSPTIIVGGYIRKNVFRAPKEKSVAHGGVGKIDFLRPFANTDFESNLSFIDFVEIPPSTSIGYHKHGANEEVYFIVDGTGTMTTNGESYQVEAGDLIVNKAWWQHGLVNSGNNNMKVLVWEVALN